MMMSVSSGAGIARRTGRRTEVEIVRVAEEREVGGAEMRILGAGGGDEVNELRSEGGEMCAVGRAEKSFGGVDAEGCKGRVEEGKRDFEGGGEEEVGEVEGGDDGGLREVGGRKVDVR